MIFGYDQIAAPKQVHRFNLAANNDATIDIVTAANLVAGGSEGHEDNQRPVIVAADIHMSAAGVLVFESNATEVVRVQRSADLLVVNWQWNPDGWVQGTAAQTFRINNAGTLTLNGFIYYIKR